jgi:excinuclease ABC subunit C
MRQAADGEQFERAAHLRDAIRTLQTLRERQQKMATTQLGDRDAFGVKSGPSGSVVQVFQMRGGRVVERVELVTDIAGAESPSGAEARVPATGDWTTTAEADAEVLQAAVQQFYQDRDIPPEIHVPLRLPDADVL